MFTIVMILTYLCISLIIICFVKWKCLLVYENKKPEKIRVDDVRRVDTLAGMCPYICTSLRIFSVISSVCHPCSNAAFGFFLLQLVSLTEEVMREGKKQFLTLL